MAGKPLSSLLQRDLTWAEWGPQHLTQLNLNPLLKSASQQPETGLRVQILCYTSIQHSALKTELVISHTDESKDLLALRTNLRPTNKVAWQELWRATLWGHHNFWELWVGNRGIPPLFCGHLKPVNCQFPKQNLCQLPSSINLFT